MEKDKQNITVKIIYHMLAWKICSNLGSFDSTKELELVYWEFPKIVFKELKKLSHKNPFDMSQFNPRDQIIPNLFFMLRLGYFDTIRRYFMCDNLMKDDTYIMGLVWDTS